MFKLHNLIVVLPLFPQANKRTLSSLFFLGGGGCKKNKLPFWGDGKRLKFRIAYVKRPCLFTNVKLSKSIPKIPLLTVHGQLK